MTKRGIRRLIILVLLLAIGAGAVGGALLVRRNMNERDIARAREQGMALYNAGEREAALPFLSKYIGRVKDDPETLIAYADSRQTVPMPNGGHIPRAIAALRAAVELEPANVDAKIKLLELYLAVQFFTETNDIASAILALDPSNETALTARTVALINLNRPEEAIESAGRLAESHGDRLASHFIYTQVLAATGRPVADQAEYVRSLDDRFNDNQNYLAWRSNMEYDLWRTDATAESTLLDTAVEFAKRAASADPLTAEGVATIAFELLPDLQAAVVRVRRGESSDSTPPPEQASEPLIALADDLLRRSLENPAIGAALALEAVEHSWWADRPEAAAAYAERVRDEARVDDPATRGWLRLVTGRAENPEAPPAAIGDAQGATGDAAVWQAIIAAADAIESGTNETALRVLQGVTTEDTDLNAVVMYFRGITYRRIGDLRSAAVEFQNAAESGTISRDRAWNALGDTLARLGRSDESRLAFNRMRNQQSTAQPRFDGRLRDLAQQPDPRTALALTDALGRALETEPGNPVIRVRLAHALLLAGRTEPGLEEVRTLLAEGGRPDPNGAIALAGTLRTLDTDLALDVLKAAQPDAPDITLSLARARIMAQAGRLDEARGFIEEHIAGQSESAVIEWRLALVRLLDQFDARAALEAMWALSDDFKDTAIAQVGVLSSANAWRDLELVKAAVARLRQSSGETSLTWRVFNARVTLADDPTDEELSKVALDLADVLRQTPDDFDTLVLAAQTFQTIAERRRESGNAADVSTQVTQAAAFFDRAVGSGGRAFAFRPYVEMLLEYGRNREANEVLNRFLDISSLPPQARADRVELLARVRRFGDAVDDQQWFATNGEPGSRLVLAQLQASSGDFGSARRVIEDLPDDAPLTADDRLRLANIYAIMRDFDGVGETLAGLPESSELGDRRTVTAGFYSDQRRPDLALPLLTEIARESDEPDTWVRAIQAAFGAGQLDTAQQLIAEAGSAFPNAPELAVFGAEAVTRTFSQLVASSLADATGAPQLELAALAGSHAIAEISDTELLLRLERFSAEHPGIYPAYRLRSTVQKETGDLAGAIRTEQAAALALPTNPLPRRELVRLLQGAGRTDDAISVARELVELSRPDTYDADLIIAQLQLSKRDFRSALNQMVSHQARVIAESRSSPTEGLVAYVTALAGVGDTTRAYEIARNLRPSPAWLQVLAQAAGALPTTELATRRAWLQEASDSIPPLQAAGAWVSLAEFSGEPADAERALTYLQAVDESAQTPAATWLRAEAQRLAGRAQEAEQDYRALLAQFPNDSAPLLRLSEVLAHQPSTAPEAIELAQRGIERLRDRPDAQASLIPLRVRLALAQASTGATADARRTLEAALADAPQDPEALLALAELEADAGRAADATALLVRIRDPEALVATLRIRYADLSSRLD